MVLEMGTSTCHLIWIVWHGTRQTTTDALLAKDHIVMNINLRSFYSNIFVLQKVTLASEFFDFDGKPPSILLSLSAYVKLAQHGCLAVIIDDAQYNINTDTFGSNPEVKSAKSSFASI